MNELLKTEILSGDYSLLIYLSYAHHAPLGKKFENGIPAVIKIQAGSIVY